jgi:type IV pilus assembly protein PilM
MIDFLTLKNKSFGIDLSDKSVKIADLKEKGRFFKLDSWGGVELEKGTIEEGEIKNEEKLIESLAMAMKNVHGKKLKTKSAIVSLPEKKAFFEMIKMPLMSQEELKSAVPYEAENYIPLPAAEAYIDFEIIPRLDSVRKDYLNILLAVMPKKTVDSYVSCLKNAGIMPEVLEVESMAISRALIKDNFSMAPVLIVDFNRSRTSFIIFYGNSLHFTSSVPISSEMLDASIAQALDINLKEAERLKIKYGLQSPSSSRKSDKNPRQKKLFSAMIPILADLAGQTKKCLAYYETHTTIHTKKKVEKIILSGRASNLKGLADYLSSKLKLPVEQGNPWTNILPKQLKEVPQLSLDESLGYTTALGLALRGIKKI